MLDGKTLPHDYYFSPDILKLELSRIFNSPHVSGFLGHKSFVPNKGDYMVTSHNGEQQILTNDGTSVHVVDNICRHRYAVMLEGRGNAGRIVCPVHCWSYHLDGTLAKAPGFDHIAESNCGDGGTSLGRKDLVDYDSFLVSAANNTLTEALEAVKDFTSLRINQLQFISQEACQTPVNWKDYVDTFLDLYHIEAYHPGLSGLVSSSAIDNFWGDGFHIQAVKNKGVPRIKKGAFKELAATYNEKIGSFDEPYSAIWITIYPGTMIEMYEKYMVLNVVRPVSPEECMVWKYSFAHDSLTRHQDVLDHYSSFLAEIEAEDVDLMKRVSAGRKMLYERGETYRGPFHPTKEDGQERFHRWVLDKLASPQ